MTKTKRWIQSALVETTKSTTRMPWDRGLRRQAFIAGRAAAAKQASKTTSTLRPAA